ncbi:hypothetical protein WN51_05635 [Melipona quadrifasciata]|uniref:Uncharacterized protein n=1 Tax=Melipona quadrifasciata TaxID=166423 RepID=A0A0M8ZV67_9HYME|nr:hypothetical protein WN51_05635 [Melipona quadrifasciata]
MKKDRVKQLNTGTSQNDFSVKPYGFCCDIKDYDPRLFVSKEPEVLFPSNGPTEGGPNIKFRIEEHNDIEPPSQRNARNKIIEPSVELMICKRSRGPLRWYLEDEIAAARDIMMKKKQEIYNAEMEKNIKLAKKKGI